MSKEKLLSIYGAIAITFFSGIMLAISIRGIIKLFWLLFNYPQILLGIFFIGIGIIIRDWFYINLIMTHKELNLICSIVFYMSVQKDRIKYRWKSALKVFGIFILIPCWILGLIITINFFWNASWYLKETSNYRTKIILQDLQIQRQQIELKIYLQDIKSMEEELNSIYNKRTNK